MNNTWTTIRNGSIEEGHGIPNIRYIPRCDIGKFSEVIRYNPQSLEGTLVKHISSNYLKFKGSLKNLRKGYRFGLNLMEFKRRSDRPSVVPITKDDEKRIIENDIYNISKRTDVVEELDYDEYYYTVLINVIDESGLPRCYCFIRIYRVYITYWLHEKRERFIKNEEKYDEFSPLVNALLDWKIKNFRRRHEII